MKKFIAFMIILCMMLPCVVIAESFDPFEGKDNVTLSMLGGSLTASDGSYYSTRGWSDKLYNEYYPQTYSNKTYTLKKAGVGGTGSEYGLLRFAFDVGIHNPDIVFIEYGVNDRGYPEADKSDVAKRNMESIIRQCMSLPSKPYVAIIGLTVYDFKTEILKLHQEVADYYNIPMLDLSGYIKAECDRQEGDDYREKFIAAFGGNDGVHPNDDGYQKWYDEIVRQMDELGSSFYRRPEDKAAIYNNETEVRGLSNVAANKINELPMPEDWEIGAEYKGQTGVNVTTYTTDVVGAVLNFKFQGNSLAFLAQRGNELGKFKLTVDKGTAKEQSKTFTQFFQTTLGYAGKTSYVMSLGGLSNEWHTAEIENLENDITVSDESITPQSRTMLAYYCTNAEKETPDIVSAEADGVPKTLKDRTLIVPVGTSSIKVFFDGEYDNINDSTVTLCREGEVMDYTGTYDSSDKSFTFAMNTPFDAPNQKYTIVLSADLELNGIKLENEKYISVLTNSGMYFDKLSFTDANGGELSAQNMSSVKFEMTGHNNAKEGAEKVFVAVAQKSAEGRLKAVCTDVKDIAAGGTNSFTAQMNLLDAVSTDSIEITAWKYTNNVPYMEKLIYSLESFVVTKAGDNVGVFFANPVALSAEVGNLSLVRNGRSIVVTGMSANDRVTVLITDMSGRIVYLNQAEADAEGNFEINCKLVEIADETYTINVN